LNKNILFLILVAVFAHSLLCFAQDKDLSSPLANGDIGRSARALLDVLKRPSLQYEKNAYTHYILAELYKRNDDFKRAYAQYRMSARYAGDALEPKLGQVYSLYKQHKIRQAFKILNALPSASQGNFKVAALRFFLFIAQDDIAEAEKVCRGMDDAFPSKPLCVEVLASVYITHGNLTKAIEAYETLSRIRPSVRSLLVAGLLYSSVGEFQKAEAFFKNARALDPGSKEAIQDLINLDIKKEDFESAARNVDALKEIAPQARETYYYGALVHYYRGEIDDAKRLLRESVTLFPEDEKSYFFLGAISFFLENDASSAIGYLEKSLARDPAFYKAHYLLGVIYDTLGKRPDAVRELEKAVTETHPDTGEALNYLGYLYAQEGENLNEALALVSRALEVEPENPSYLDSLGWIYYKKGMCEKARDYLTRATTRIDEKGERKFYRDVYRHLSVVYRACGEYGRSAQIALSLLEEETNDTLFQTPLTY